MSSDFQRSDHNKRCYDYEIEMRVWQKFCLKPQGNGNLGNGKHLLGEAMPAGG
jgi:hypothetical protein